jgi:putative transposase
MTTQRPGRGGAATSGERAAARPLGAGGADHPDPGKRLRAAGDPARPGQRRRAARDLMAAVDAVAPDLGATQACRALGISRATLYRRRRPVAPPASSLPRPRPPRALSDAERHAVGAVLHAPRFVDLAPAEVVATLLDEAATSPRSGPCTASWPTPGRPASDATSSPTRAMPGQSCWRPGPTSCGAPDSTKLLGPATWTY